MPPALDQIDRMNEHSPIGFDGIELGKRTDVGVRRSHNQDDLAIHPATDAARWEEQGHVFIVADGMGGHAVGEKASAKAVRDIPHTYQKYAHEGPNQALRKAFIEANAGIHAIGIENPEFKGLGTTATTLVLRKDGVWIAHVGDSRAYRIRGYRIEQLTFDHSAVWEVAKRRQVPPEELMGAIRSNVILRSLGPESFVEVDVEGPHPVLPGDIFLLCSDGLSGSVTDFEIGAVARSLPPAEACDFLVELANLRGGPDNITVLIARMPGETPAYALASSAEIVMPTKPKSPAMPWPLFAMIAGLILSLAAIVFLAFNLPGGFVLFALATAAIVIGGIGLGLHSHQAAKVTALPDQPAKLNVYRNARCTIDKTLLDKLVEAENLIRLKLQEAGQPCQPPATIDHGEMEEAFRKRCRAIAPLLKAFNSQRNKEEVFQPVWDKVPR